MNGEHSNNNSDNNNSNSNNNNRDRRRHNKRQRENGDTEEVARAAVVVAAAMEALDRKNAMQQQQQQSNLHHEPQRKSTKTELTIAPTLSVYMANPQQYLPRPEWIHGIPPTSPSTEAIAQAPSMANNDNDNDNDASDDNDEQQQQHRHYYIPVQNALPFQRPHPAMRHANPFAPDPDAPPVPLPAFSANRFRQYLLLQANQLNRPQEDDHENNVIANNNVHHNQHRQNHPHHHARPNNLQLEQRRQHHRHRHHRHHQHQQQIQQNNHDEEEVDDQENDDVIVDDDDDNDNDNDSTGTALDEDHHQQQQQQRLPVRQELRREGQHGNTVSTPLTFGKDYDPALHMAIREGATQAALALLRYGASVSSENVKGVTPLILAAQKGNLVVVQDLLARGANPAATSANGTTAILQAAHFGHLDVLKLLLHAGGGARVIELANYNHTTPLMRAAQEGHTQVVHYLLQQGAVVNRPNRVQMTALMLAAQRGHAEICKLLIQYGADMDAMTAQDSTSLLLACKRNHQKVIEVLVTAGCELWVRDARNRTARDIAVRREMHNMAYMLDPIVQINMMRYEARRQRSVALMRMYALLQQERASVILEPGKPGTTIHQLVPLLLQYNDLPYHLSQSTTLALLRTMALPLPLVQLIVQYAPLPTIWDKRIGMLTKRCLVNADAATLCGLDLIDEIIEDGGFLRACDDALVPPPARFSSWRDWKVWCCQNTQVMPSRPEARIRPNATLATVPPPQDPNRPSLIELRREIGYLSVLKRYSPTLVDVLTHPPYNMPPVVVGQLETVHDIQSLARRMGTRGVHFDPPVAMDLIMLTSRLCSWYSGEREQL